MQYNKYIGKNLKSLFILISSIFFIILLFCFIDVHDIKKKQGYSLFIQFSNAYGIKEGTNVVMRGVSVGYIKNIKININSILVLIYIKSSNILIPKNSLIETNQVGLFNNTIIDIIPMENLAEYSMNDIDVFSSACLTSPILCNYHYIKGVRGLNYDDLIRATTRISQRFDDPSLFHLFYAFLKNILQISDDFIFISIYFNSLFSFLENFL
uniref:Mce/MlaD domain-containing protein n=1 Tax=Spyridia filamentosa TaxID=196632 RepID=A0A1Z1MJU1_SPYFI|nr:hypothetical protein [Spyridia filamentosa]ARW66159.1 hypothetical protein [Spyridia filamentosa]